MKQVLFVSNELASHALDCGVFPSFTCCDECRKVLLSDFEEIVTVSVAVINLVAAKEVAQFLVLLWAPVTRAAFSGVHLLLLCVLWK